VGPKCVFMTIDPQISGVIRAVVDRLVAGYAPAKVILFGSHAAGRPDPDSDIDLLVIKETSRRFLDRLDEVRRLTAGAHPHVPLDAIVLTPAEVEDRLRSGDQFIAGIIGNGELLYAA